MVLVISFLLLEALFRRWEESKQCVGPWLTLLRAWIMWRQSPGLHCRWDWRSGWCLGSWVLQLNWRVGLKSSKKLLIRQVQNNRVGKAGRCLIFLDSLMCFWPSRVNCAVSCVGGDALPHWVTVLYPLLPTLLPRLLQQIVVNNLSIPARARKRQWPSRRACQAVEANSIPVLSLSQAGGMILCRERACSLKRCVGCVGSDPPGAEQGFGCRYFTIRTSVAAARLAQQPSSSSSWMVAESAPSH